MQPERHPGCTAAGFASQKGAVQGDAYGQGSWPHLHHMYGSEMKALGAHHPLLGEATLTGKLTALCARGMSPKDASTLTVPSSMM